ncbi:MAG: SufE family protein [Arenicellales bacterium]
MSLSTEITLERIMETFEMLPDWENRYQFLDELGTKLETMDAVDQNDETRVMECMSMLWIKAKPSETKDLIDFDADCNTSTIKGVVALIIALFANKTNTEIQTTDIDEVFKELQLFEHLSPNRHVGVYAIVRKMKAQAAALQLSA